MTIDKVANVFFDFFSLYLSLCRFIDTTLPRKPSQTTYATILQVENITTEYVAAHLHIARLHLSQFFTSLIAPQNEMCHIIKLCVTRGEKTFSSVPYSPCHAPEWFIPHHGKALFEK